MKLLTKVSAVFAFFAALLLSAAPIDYIPANSIGIINVNTTGIVNHPIMQNFLPMFQQELSKYGFSANDLKGSAAVGFVITDAATKSFQITVAAESDSPVANKVFDLIRQDNKDVQLTQVAGKRAFKDNESRLIVMSPRMLLAQFAEGSNKNFPLPRIYKNRISSKPGLRNYTACAFLDVSKVLAIVPQEEIPAEARAEIQKVRSLILGIKILADGGIKIDLVAVCATANDAQYLINFVNAAKQQFASVPELAELAKKLQPQLKERNIVLSVSFTGNEVNQIFAAAMSAASTSSAQK